MGLTTDRNDPGLGYGTNDSPVPQNEKYLVLPPEELAKGLVEPYRNKYVHLTCGAQTTMGETLSQTYARDPRFYGATYCAHCKMHRTLDEFVWDNPSNWQKGGMRQSMVPVERYLSDGPCWCLSESEPHEGWIHAPRCLELKEKSARIV